MNSVKLENKYQSLIDRIELIKKRPIMVSHTVDMLNQIIEFCSKKKILILSLSKFMISNQKILIK